MATVDFAKTERLVKTFTPTQPISLPDLLSGRLDLLYRLQADTHMPGQHILLYGDRGVGKTSIARVLAAIVAKPDEDAGMRSFFVSCNTTDTYGSIWQKVLQQMTFTLPEPQLGFVQDEDRQRVVGFPIGQPIESPSDIHAVIESLPYPTVIVIDEYDRVTCERTRLLMADTIKLFSDFGTECTIVLVGVGDSIQQLIEAHESVSRHVDFVEVETMPPDELAEIITAGFEHCDMECDPGLDFSIARMSQGYPHYTHLLGLWSGMGAVERNSGRVTSDDLARAVPRSIQNAVGGIRLEYERATDSIQPNNLFKQVLLACAMAEKGR